MSVNKRVKGLATIATAAGGVKDLVVGAAEGAASKEGFSLPSFGKDFAVSAEGAMNSEESFISSSSSLVEREWKLLLVSAGCFAGDAQQ